MGLSISTFRSTLGLTYPAVPHEQDLEFESLSNLEKGLDDLLLLGKEGNQERSLTSNRVDWESKKEDPTHSDFPRTLIISSTPQGRTVHWQEKQIHQTLGVPSLQSEELPFQEGTLSGELVGGF